MVQTIGGGIEADLTITRIDQDEFLVVTAAASGTRDEAWLRRGCRGHHVTITDVTTEYSMFGVMGPNSRALLSELTSADLGNDAFPFATMQRIDIAGHEVLALRLSYVGELGWELYVPWDEAASLYDAIFAAGGPHGLKHAGYHAMNTLRLETGYRSWGPRPLRRGHTPRGGTRICCGLGETVFRRTGGVDGAAGTATNQTTHPIPPRGSRPSALITMNPSFVTTNWSARTSSGMWSYVEDRCLAMGYLNNPRWGDEGVARLRDLRDRSCHCAHSGNGFDPFLLRPGKPAGPYLVGAYSRRSQRPIRTPDWSASELLEIGDHTTSRVVARSAGDASTRMRP